MFYCYVLLSRDARNAPHEQSPLTEKSSYHLHIALLLYEHYNDTLHKNNKKTIITAVRIDSDESPEPRLYVCIKRTFYTYTIKVFLGCESQSGGF